LFIPGKVRFLLLTIVIILSSCATGKLYINGSNEATGHASVEKPIYTIYAVGDAGEENEQSQAVLHALAEQTKDDTHPGMVLFLGDNIYPAGLAKQNDKEARQYGERLLTQQVRSLDGYQGDIIFIPGNHDWNEFKPGGLEAIKREGEFLQNFNQPNLKLLPEDGCGGPFVKELNHDAVLLIIDSQWWIQDWQKEPKMNEGCGVGSREEMISRLQELFAKYKDRQILLAMHHPLESRGPHGGYFSFRDHVFPLTKVVNWLYLPLPVMGSIYPWYRQIIGHPQDQSGKAYKAMKESILGIAGNEKLIFLAGHDHNLQYLKFDGQDMIVSGAGSKQNAIADGKDLIYGHQSGGFMTLDFFPGKVIVLSSFEVGEAGNKPILVFREKIRG